MINQEAVVIYTSEPEKLVTFLSGLDLQFVREQHDTGPVHWACQKGEQVLEVYPASSDRIRFMS